MQSIWEPAALPSFPPLEGAVHTDVLIIGGGIAGILCALHLQQAGVDYVLIDCPAGIEQGFCNAVAGADSAIVVTMPEVSAVRDADRVIGLLRAYDLPAPRLIINRVRAGMVRRGDMMSTEDMLEMLSVELLGVIPDEETVIRAGNLGQPVARGNTPVSLAYRNIAARLLGDEVPVLSLHEQRGGFLRRLLPRRYGM